MVGAQWLYWKVVGKYSYSKYHEANEEKLKEFGTVVREDVMWNFPLIHIFNSKVSCIWDMGRVYVSNYGW